MNDNNYKLDCRTRLTKLFEYLKAFNDLKNPVIRDIHNEIRVLALTSLPDHPNVKLYKPDETEKNTDSPVLKIQRPIFSKCPEPSIELQNWLKRGWDDPYLPISIFESITNKDKDVNAKESKFDSSLDRVNEFKTWRKLREEWVATEKPNREVMKLFENIYEWYGLLEREGDKVELLIGDGYLECDGSQDMFKHPILLQKLEFEFYPSKSQPEFVFDKTDKPPELYIEFLHSLPDANIQQIGKCRNELEQSNVVPLGGSETSGFLRRLIHGVFPNGGKLFESTSIKVDRPFITRDAFIFIRSKKTGRAHIFDSILQDIISRFETGEPYSQCTLEILGLFKPINIGVSDEVDKIKSDEYLPEDILFSKPSNHEQISIARKLQNSDGVLVQGPPGTGKTYTIANIIGHLLSQGKRILVTAHTAKALNVLRAKVVDELQPLCVSVLQRDRKSQDELKESINKMISRLTEDENRLEEEANAYSAERKNYIKQLSTTRQELLDARYSEIQEVVIAGRAYGPIEAAKIVKKNECEHILQSVIICTCLNS